MFWWTVWDVLFVLETLETDILILQWDAVSSSSGHVMACGSSQACMYESQSHVAIANWT